MKVFLIPVLDDNYIFVLHDESRHLTAVIDPAESRPVHDFLNQQGWSLDEIWITHHHWDHVGGIDELKREYSATVRCHALDQHRIPSFDLTHQHGDVFKFAGENVEVHQLDGHTLGHVCYLLPDAKILFSGDTIFAMGCGRLFEGSPEQMFSSLTWIASLPEDTKIYCTHEYTLANVRFSLSVLPENQEIQKRAKEVQKLRKTNTPTIPTTVEIERKTNPFLLAQDADDFARLRKLKDHF